MESQYGGSYVFWFFVQLLGIALIQIIKCILLYRYNRKLNPEINLGDFFYYLTTLTLLIEDVEVKEPRMHRQKRIIYILHRILQADAIATLAYFSYFALKTYFG